MAIDDHEDLAARVQALGGAWFHSIDLGNGLVTPGRKSAPQLQAELDALQLGDLSGASVLDVGAWDGYFSFAAERLGASRVVSLDHYVWSIDFDARYRYAESCRRDGRRPRPWHEVPGVWSPDALPGKAGYDIAHEALGSSAEAVVSDFMGVEPASLGTFDVVLFLGVLYHVTDPFAALRKVASLTSGMAIIETAAVSLRGTANAALWEFHPDTDLEGDPTNWWSPTRRGLETMCLAAGFHRVEVEPIAGGPRLRRLLTPRGVARHRLVARAWR